MKALTSTKPPKPRYDLAIVGGGIMGLAIAYHLALRNCTNVVVLEGRYLAYGASGRNGGGIRQQWSSPLNIEVMKESVAICGELAKELGIHVWFRQGGYLFVSRSEAEAARLASRAELHRKHGVPTRMITAAEAKALVPQLDVSSCVAACYNPTDGLFFPWPFLWGYAQRSLERGVDIYTHAPVTAIRRGSGYALTTPRGTILADRIINAAGAWSPTVAKLVGVELPNRPVRHEILSTEALRPFVDPLVSDLSTGLYFSQSMRGEIVAGITLHTELEERVTLGATLAFPARLAKELVHWMPGLADVKVVRQWAGPYDVTSDGSPLLGELPEAPGFLLCCGFKGHGFMMAPAVGKHYAAWLTGGPKHEIFHRYRATRFAEGEPAHEDFFIG